MAFDEQKLKDENWRLRSFLEDLFDKLIFMGQALRVILYIGSVGLSWFWLKDKFLAVGIALSLTLAHSMVAFDEYLRKKRKELTEKK